MELAAPVLAVCGFSGSGKTTLVEGLVPLLRAQGLEVGVIKHDAHGVTVDYPGKDSDRLFQAGAEVFVRAPNETFARFHPDPRRDLLWALDLLSRQVDLILVEGHKDTPLPKVWLEHPENPEVPPGVTHVVARLAWGQERTGEALAVILRSARENQPPLWVGVLMGGESSRMGSPKQLVPVGNRSALCRLAELVPPQTSGVAYLGGGPLPTDAPQAPQIPDPPGPRGPLAGMVAALRWQPLARWLFVPVDAVAATEEFLAWFAGQDRPGVWAVQPKGPTGQLEPVFSLVRPQLARYLEGAWLEGLGPRVVAAHPKAAAIPVPENLADALATANTPEEWAKLTASGPSPKGGSG